MIPVRRALLAFAGSLLILPFAASAAQSADQASDAPSAAETPVPKPDSDAAKEVTAEETKRVCKSIRADPSSRRKTKVCRTVEEWRNLNNIR